MPKWADYLISGVHYSKNGGGQYISKVYAHHDKIDNIGPVFTLTRDELCDIMDKNGSIMTIFRNNVQWDMGKEVRKIKINNNFYFRTDNNYNEEDNLENLPQF
jgi:hypothetical protein